MTKQRLITLSSGLTGILALLLGVFLLWTPNTSQAQETANAPTGDNSFCAVCHTADAQGFARFANGSTLPIAVDTVALAASVHGSANPDGALGCVDCHSSDKFPHTQAPAASLREYRITQSNLCVDCHTEQAENLADDVHYTALVNGNTRAATCVDCHGSHDIQSPSAAPQVVAETCGDCHSIIFEEFSQSVHGESLFAGDMNVPTCTDCHGVHGIQHPTTALFRNNSPQLCADCHADEDLMSEYDITTNVFDSYLTDFHGTTVALFDQQDPNVASNKAVCSDCHGVHNITRSDDTKSQVVRENLLATCQECHPNATSDFPDSWVGHYQPTFESHPLLFLVDWFYKILIPVVIGGFIFLVGTDIYHRIRRRGQSHEGGH